MLTDNRRRGAVRMAWALVLGFFLGGLLTRLSEMFLPDSAARTFLTTSVSLSVGPFSLDLLALALTVGPLAVNLNVLTAAGVFLVALVVRSWI
ncbi:MAG: hypothetical protein OXI46_08760 [Gemmatimonadota bacterium]|nr:hypothetical protein [Gemmatimonadota bacterium]